MRLRKKSFGERARETVPVFVIVVMGIAGVFVAMNVLVTAVPTAIDNGSPSPSTRPVLFASGLPTGGPFVDPTEATSTPGPTASLPSVPPTIVNSAVSEKDPDGAWVVYLRYPAFVVGTTPWADSIDADILVELRTRAAQFEQGPASDRRADGKVNTLTGSFTTELLTPALASFTLTLVDETTPGHTTTTVETLNLDLGTGQRISFGDVFMDSQTALTVLFQQAPPLLLAKLGAAYDQAVATEGTGPIMANYTHWALTPAGFKVTFSQSQVAALDQGLPFVVFPWTDLKSIMVATGPVAQLAGF